MNRLTPLKSWAIIVVALVSIAAALAGGCTKEEKQPQKQAEAPPDMEKIEAARKVREQKIKAEKEAISAWIRANTVYPIVPSVAAAVVEGDEVIYRETLRCDPATPFMAASLTKTFTALSILQLAERNIITLSDPISKYLGVTFENEELKSSPITIWHLLTHTSGLVEDPNPKYEKNNYPFTVPEQKYPTGYRFNYCNQGYNLLGFIVFEASGLPFGEYVTRNILAPMEMRDSRAPAAARGAAGIECSINDLAKYMIMFLHGGAYRGKRIISKRMYRLIIEETIESPQSRKKEYRGLCFRIWSMDGAIYSMHHAAHMPGSGGFMQFFPRGNCGYVFISNPPEYDRNEYYAYYYGIKSRLVGFCGVLMDGGFDPVHFEADRPSVAQLKLFVGRYRQYTDPEHGGYIDIALHPGGYLTAVKSYTGQQYGIEPTSLHTFVYIYPGQNEKGEIYDFVIKNNKVVGLGVKEGYFVK
jgi:CubicO group peptidase (beta-lactamase class C family)